MIRFLNKKYTKVVFEENTPVDDTLETPTLNVTFEVLDEYLIIEWDKINTAQGYKVVASEEGNMLPTYPQDGNFMYTEDNYVKIYFGQKYNGGDFYELTRNKEYLFNINVYNYEGNAIPTKTFKVSTY
jgi:hypothetical protein